MLDRFELIDGILRGRREELIELRTAAGDINLSLLESATTSINPTNGLPESRIQWNADLAKRVGQLRDALKAAQPLPSRADGRGLTTGCR